MYGTDNCDLIRRGTAAFAAGDVATLREILAPDVVHVVPGTSVLAGAHSGVDDVVELYGRLAELSGGTLRMQVHQLLTDGADRVVLTYRGTARRYGAALDSENALIFTVAGGRVARVEHFLADADLRAHDEFWGTN